MLQLLHDYLRIRFEFPIAYPHTLFKENERIILIKNNSNKLEILIHIFLDSNLLV
jgi:hypothetical protein